MVNIIQIFVMQFSAILVSSILVVTIGFVSYVTMVLKRSNSNAKGSLDYEKRSFDFYYSGVLK